jgi:hypothetical protein
MKEPGTVRMSAVPGERTLDLLLLKESLKTPDMLCAKYSRRSLTKTKLHQKWARLHLPVTHPRRLFVPKNVLKTAF